MNLLPIFEPIRDDLATVETRMMAAVRETYEPLSSALEHLLASGGKRLRPALVILSARLGHWAPDAAVDLAAAVEMLHTATLIHDDTIDQATMRRGQQTLNATWSRSATILAGDFLFARAALLAAATSNMRVTTIFARTLVTICEGELKQMLTLFNWQGELDGYYRRIFSKTASLFAASTEAGAILSDAPEAQVHALRAYGEHLGMAFQIVDDILDMAGDERRLGKPVGSDLRQGIATLPVYHFVQNGGDRDLLDAALDRNQDDATRFRSVGRLVSAIVASPAIETCRQEACDLAARAVGDLAGLPESPYRSALQQLAEFCVARDL